MKRRAGFTIMEMAIVLAIIGLLVILTVPKISNWFNEIAVQNSANELASDIRFAEALEQTNYAKVNGECYYLEFQPNNPPYDKYEIYHYESSNKIVDKSVSLKYGITCSGTVGSKTLKRFRFNRFYEAVPYDTDNHSHSTDSLITVKKGQFVHTIKVIYLTGDVVEQ